MIETFYKFRYIQISMFIAKIITVFKKKKMYSLKFFNNLGKTIQSDIII